MYKCIIQRIFRLVFNNKSKIIFPAYLYCVKNSANLPERLILFDGVCNLCNGTVQLIIRLDKKKRFRYASLQSEKGREILADFTTQQLPDSFFYLKKGKLYSQSSAALLVGIELGFPANLIGVAYVFPGFFRDFVYDLIAANRYRWFGKTETCMVPDPNISSLFIS